MLNLKKKMTGKITNTKIAPRKTGSKSLSAHRLSPAVDLVASVRNNSK